MGMLVFLLLKDFTKIKTIIKREDMFNSSQPVDWLIYFGRETLKNREYNPKIKQKKNRKSSAISVMNVAKKIFIYEKINLFMFGNIKENNYDFISL